MRHLFTISFLPLAELSLVWYTRGSLRPVLDRGRGWRSVYFLRLELMIERKE